MNESNPTTQAQIAPPPRRILQRKKLDTSQTSNESEVVATTPSTNKGTGAGGSNTNILGKRFEDLTDNESRLISQGFVRSGDGNILQKDFGDKKIFFTKQQGLKTFLQKKFGKSIFRFPDEAYIMEYPTGKIRIKILEKKEQNREGSVETKLWSGPSLKREYEIALNEEFQIHYGFCVSDFLKKKLTSDHQKYIILNKILQESNIAVLFGNDENYFDTLDDWLNSS